MKVLDTNVVAEMMAVAPNPNVLAYLDALAERPFLTAVTVAELQFGVQILPAGKRKRRLFDAVTRLVAGMGEQGILGFNAESAIEYAAVAADRRKRGRPISQFDALIAAICRVHGAELITRDVKDFEGTGLHVINPWKA